MKVSSSVVQRKQVIYIKQQNVLIRGCLKNPSCSVPPLCHLNPFPDLLAPTDSIFPFQGNGELLDGSRQCMMYHLTASKALGCGASARRREGGKPSAVACMWQCETCQDSQIFPPHSSSDSLSSATLIIQKLSVQ